MTSPSGWQEPGQRPEFEEITVVLRGMVRVEHEGGVLDVRAGQAVVTAPGEWVRYSTPEPDGAEYVAVCLPAFSPATVHRDDADNSQFLLPVLIHLPPATSMKRRSSTTLRRTAATGSRAPLHRARRRAASAAWARARSTRPGSPPSAWISV